jgi:hypothetical protein
LVCFGCFASIPKQRASMFWLNRNKQKTHPNSLKENIFGYFSDNVGLFRFVSFFYETVLFVSVFDIGSKHRNKPKFLFLVSRNKRNKHETDLVSVCFGSNRNLFLIVSRTPYSSNSETLEYIEVLLVFLSLLIIYSLLYCTGRGCPSPSSPASILSSETRSLAGLAT